MKHFPRAWNSEHPILLCAHGVTREVACQLLSSCKVGTFIVRFSSLAGAIVISSKVTDVPHAPENGINHLIIDEYDLSMRPLETWVRDTPWAQRLLDIENPSSTLDKRDYYLPRYVRLGYDRQE
eukprot:CAMPEP_0170153666 /NCGR_PEP_ID=MMETSP0033_2-20121228/55910_1 /TAXON_ID=195969 /ORGANISM="Dolichomastix tenuilepis, Strain CCMP3274" /LENGTH=123 /DNA_ID=CAMNT_0010390877 /DNA_START=15 /DNA_END=383 /DNA_ORIENTATION=-